MNLKNKITLALGLLAATGTSFAQTATDTRGALGQRYVELGFAALNLEELSDETYNAGIALNSPVVPSLLDVGASYDYTRFRGEYNLRGHANTAFVSATAYTALHGVRPFVTAGVGYQWYKLPFGLSGDDGVWRGGVGLEIPFGAFSLTPRIVYNDDFNSGSGSWSYAVEGNYWFSSRSAAFAKVAFENVRNSGTDVRTYQIGLRMKL